MGLKVKPATYIYICDRCMAMEEHGERLSNSRPNGWSIVNLERAGMDWQGNEVADASARHLLCHKCTGDFDSMLRAWLEED